MPAKKTIASPTTASIAFYVKKNATHVKKSQQHRHGAADSVREATYQGHHIVVRTRYDIEVDGRSIMGHTGVTNDGQVHYHPIPNMSFASAIDMVKELINVFPDDFIKKANGTKSGKKKKRGTKKRHTHH